MLDAQDTAWGSIRTPDAVACDRFGGHGLRRFVATSGCASTSASGLVGGGGFGWVGLPAAARRGAVSLPVGLPLPRALPPRAMAPVNRLLLLSLYMPGRAALARDDDVIGR